MELTSELIRKHIDRVAEILEGRVRAHERTSKKGKRFRVNEFSRKGEPGEGVGKLSHGLLKWRMMIGPTRIMTSREFKRIAKKAKKRGHPNPSAVAGFAYWRRAQKMYRRYKKHKRAA